MVAWGKTEKRQPAAAASEGEGMGIEKETGSHDTPAMVKSVINGNHSDSSQRKNAD